MVHSCTEKNGDILNALSKAVGKAQQSQNNETSMRKEYRLLAQPLVKSEANKVLSDESILQACTALNMRMNKQIKTPIYTDPLLCAALNPDTLIHELGRCIQVLTRPMRERRWLFSQQELIKSLGTMKNRTMKQLYCLLTMFSALTVSVVCHCNTCFLMLYSV